MKELSAAEKISRALKRELKKPELTRVRQEYLFQKMKLVEEFINHYDKKKP